MDLVVSARTPRAIAGRVFTTVQRHFAVRFARWADLPVVIPAPRQKTRGPAVAGPLVFWLGD
jgi:hypothetical protein